MTKGRKPNPHCTACGVLKTDENTYRPASGNLRNICKACYAKKYRASRTIADLLIFRQQYVEHIEAIDAILVGRETQPIGGTDMDRASPQSVSTETI